MANQSVCVVGVSGGVGSHIAAGLLARGYDVVGTLRDPDGPAAGWIARNVAPVGEARGAALSLVAADASDKGGLAETMDGSIGVICAAGSPKNAVETIDLMTTLAHNVCDAALAAGLGAAVFTSSTGSTNPPDGEPEIKNEIDHWSDPEKQYADGKFAACAKTRYDRIILEKMAASGGKLRCAILNPSMILGPCLKDTPDEGLGAMARIIKGELFAGGVSERLHVDH